LLVAPVTRPGARMRAVYLPAGSGWYDYWTRRKHPGGQYVTATTPLDRLPIFVRAGSIIPMTKPIEYVDQKPISRIILDVYPGKKTTGYLYEDDGESFDYERDAWSLTRFVWTGGRLKIDREKSGCKSAATKYRVLVKRP